VADVHIEIDPNTSSLLTHHVETQLADEIEALGLSVEGPEPPLEQRSAEQPWPEIILLTLNLAATALKNLDDIIEIIRKWLPRPRREGAPKQLVKLYGPDGDVLAEIEQDDHE